VLDYESAGPAKSAHSIRPRVVLSLITGVVVCVLFVVFSIPLTGRTGDTLQGVCRADLANLQVMIDTFRADVGRLPTEAEGLTVLWQAPAGVTGWRGPYIKGASPLRDP
jgi:general secretion pathway protein G